VEVRKGVVYLTRDEVDEISCPTNPRWAASQIRSYGPARCARSGKLSSLLSCVSLLESVGLDYVILDEAESEVESEVPADAVAADAVPADAVPADVVPADAVPADAVPEGFCRCSPAGPVGA